MNLICQMHIMIVNICCLLLLISSCTASVEEANINLPSGIKLENITKSINDTNAKILTQATGPTKVSVATEGGGLVIDEHDQTHTSREGKADSPAPIHDVNPLQPNSTNQSASNTLTSISTLNKPPTVLPPESTNHTSKDNNISVSPNSDVKPVYEVPPKVDGKNSVPKKEPKSDSEEPPPTIILTPTAKNDSDTTKQGNTTIKNDNISNQVNTTLTKPGTNTTVATPLVNETVSKVVKEKPRKPLFTEATDDSFAPSNFVSGGKNGPSKTLVNNVPSLDNLEKRKSRSADYVVPIVGIILSVPLVAIIISVLYKRTAEWWHHRHYRRMDFLIEGMYNN